MLYLIGLGLGDPEDITVKGLNIVKKAHKVYLENYTSILSCGFEELEKFYERTIIPVDRNMMEEGCQEILDAARDADAAVLVVGDPLNATTHTDLLLRAVERKIPYKIIHNASIVNAVACCGLQIYNFGEIVSIPFWTEQWKPESYYDKILRNRKNGLHTLCLLDIKVKEPNLDLLIKGITKMDPPRFMTVSEASQQLCDIVANREKTKHDKLTRDSPPLDGNNASACEDLKTSDICVCLARIGTENQRIVKTDLKGAINLNLGPPLHSMVVPGILHPLEQEILESFDSTGQNFC